MPGLLEIKNGKAMFVGIKPAWHQLGTVINISETDEIGLTKEQVYEAVPVLAMSVRKEPIYWVDTQTQQEHEVKGYEAVIRDDGKCVGLNSSTYGLVQHDTVVDLASAIHGTGEARIVSGFTIREGRQFCIACKLLSHENKSINIDREYFIFVASSHDGSLSLVAAKSTILPVCANTIGSALWESKKSGNQIKLRHSSNVMTRVEEARRVLGLADKSFDEFDKFVVELQQQEVTNKQFDEMMAAVFPEEQDKSKRGQTVRDQWRTEVRMLHENSDYVGEFKGTGWGAFQAVNTWEQWGATIRNTTGNKNASLAQIRAERQMTAQLRETGNDYSKAALNYLIGQHDEALV